MRFSKILMPLALTAILISGCDKAKKDDGGDEPSDSYTPAKVLQDRTISSSVLGMNIKYSVWLPPTYDENKSYPVLFLLHGHEYDTSDAHNGWLKQGSLNSIATSYVRDGGEPFIIVTPNGQNAFYMDNFDKRQLKYGTFFLDEFIPQIEKTYKGNGKRAIAGLSMGGFGTLYHCFLNPGKWTYAYACSPVAGGLQELLKNCDKASLPGISIETGLDDNIVGIEDATALSELMDELGIEHEFITRRGSHSWDFWKGCLPKVLKKVGESFK